MLVSLVNYNNFLKERQGKHQILRASFFDIFSALCYNGNCESSIIGGKSWQLPQSKHAFHLPPSNVNCLYRKSTNALQSKEIK